MYFVWEFNKFKAWAGGVQCSNPLFWRLSTFYVDWISSLFHFPEEKHIEYTNCLRHVRQVLHQMDPSDEIKMYDCSFTFFFAVLLPLQWYFLHHFQPFSEFELTPCAPITQNRIEMICHFCFNCDFEIPKQHLYGDEHFFPLMNLN